MEEPIRKMVAEFRPALGWVLGAAFGLMVFLAGNFIFGFLIILGCGYMIKLKIGQSVAENALSITKLIFDRSKERIGDALASRSSLMEADVNIAEPEANAHHNSDKAVALHHFAETLWEQEDYEGCLKFTNMATNYDATLVAAWHLMGRAHDKLFHTIVESESQEMHGEAAIEAFKKTIELEPQNAHAHCQLGYFFHFFDLNRAREHYQIAANINSDFKPMLDEISERIAKTDFVIGKIKLIMLPSMRTEPTQKMLETRFSFGIEVGCAVIHTCVSGSSSKTLGGWFFKESEPDLFRHRPVKSFQIWDGFEDHRFSSSVENPSQFKFVRNHLSKENYI